MSPSTVLAFTAFLLMVGSVAFAGDAAENAFLRPRFFIYREAYVREVKRRIDDDDPAFDAALERQIHEADKALGTEPFSVTFNTPTPPSGDDRDFFSFGNYMWPNPDTEDGLPYVIKDGEVNPEARDGDAKAMKEMNRAVCHLARAWFFTGKEEYGRHAMRLLRVFFLDEETRMNPHMQYAGSWPGKYDGTSGGIICTFRFVELVGALGLLEAMRALPERRHRLAWEHLVLGPLPDVVFTDPPPAEE